MSGAADEIAAIGGGVRTASVRAVEAAEVRRRILVFVLRIAVGVAFIWLWHHASGRWIDTLLISSPEACWVPVVALDVGRHVVDQSVCDAGSHRPWIYHRLRHRFQPRPAVGAIPVLAVFDPYITAIYSIPKIALAPLFIIWFGIGIESKVAVSAAIVFFVISSTHSPACARLTRCT